jgi:hypothetical protein
MVQNPRKLSGNKQRWHDNIGRYNCLIKVDKRQNVKNSVNDFQNSYSRW